MLEQPVKDLNLQFRGNCVLNCWTQNNSEGQSTWHVAFYTEAACMYANIFIFKKAGGWIKPLSSFSYSNNRMGSHECSQKLI